MTLVIDASAIVAVILREPGYEMLERDIASSSERMCTTPIAIYETVSALCRVRSVTPAQAEADLNDFLQDTSIEVITIGRHEAAQALRGFDRFGKGRHPAALNMGACFSFALTRTLRARLLFKGDDFAHPDVQAALVL